LKPFTIGELLQQRVKEYPNKVIYIFHKNDSLKLTFADVQYKANILAQNLLEMGFEKGLNGNIR
jgi:acyl-CoA synthetase (AMP-forming)/AMP-acid ligase II